MTQALAGSAGEKGKTLMNEWSKEAEAAVKGIIDRDELHAQLGHDAIGFWKTHGESLLDELEFLRWKIAKLEKENDRLQREHYHLWKQFIKVKDSD